MPKTHPVQGFLMTPQIGGKAAHGEPLDVRQDGVSFDVKFAATQAEYPAAKAPNTADRPPGVAAGGRRELPPDKMNKTDERVPTPEQEEPADAAAMSAVIAVMMPVSTIWTAGGEGTEALPEESGELVLSGEGILQMETAAGQGSEGIYILERPAAEMAETSPNPVVGAADAPDMAESEIMEDLATNTQTREVADTPARMPTMVPIVSWETQRQDAQGSPSSLENADATETQAPPPSRVDITQVVRRQSGVQNAQNGNKQDASDLAGALSAQGTRGMDAGPAQTEAAQEPPPVMQIVEEAQIQQALGRTQFTMRLNPETLGEVTVRLTMSAEGLTARIITQTEGARQAIAGEIAVLGDSMRTRGIDVRTVEVLDGSMGHASLLHEGDRRGNAGHEGSRGRGRSSAGYADVTELPQEGDPYADIAGLTETAGIEVRA